MKFSLLENLRDPKELLENNEIVDLPAAAFGSNDIRTRAAEAL